MGTCVSKGRRSDHSRHQNLAFPTEELGNPPGEEKVKEVLSETPTPSVRRARPIEKETRPANPEPDTPEKGRMAEDESIDTSEVASVTESFSVAVTDECNARQVMQQWSRVRSFPGKREGEISGRKSSSPARMEVSPRTRMYGLGGAREVGNLTGDGRNGMRRTVSGRRSRPPADNDRRPVVDRSGSRKMAVPPGRRAIASGREDSRRMMDGGDDDGGGWKGEERLMKMHDGFGYYAPNETIENPLVSLECFIFL